MSQSPNANFRVQPWVPPRGHRKLLLLPAWLECSGSRLKQPAAARLRKAYGMAGPRRVWITIEAHWIDVPKHESLRLLNCRESSISILVSNQFAAPVALRASHLRVFLRWMSDKLVDKSKILLCRLPKGSVI